MLCSQAEPGLPPTCGEETLQGPLQHCWESTVLMSRPAWILLYFLNLNLMKSNTNNSCNLVMEVKLKPHLQRWPGEHLLPPEQHGAAGGAKPCWSINWGVPKCQQQILHPSGLQCVVGCVVLHGVLCSLLDAGWKEAPIADW